MLTPVLTIDGPTASGKGTLSRQLAKTLNFHYLDSGALYRVLALHLDRQGLNPMSDVNDRDLEQFARELPVVFDDDRILLQGDDASELIRQERIGSLASEFATKPAIRHGLLQRQWAFRRAPGLIADGRDMGTVVFPDAPLKVFLVADVAMNSAQVTLVKGDLRGIAVARTISEDTVANMKQNLVFAFLYNALGIPVAAGVLFAWTGWLLSPLIAALAMSFSSASVIGNALRLKHN